MYTYRADSLCCTAEIDVAVKSNCTQMKEKKKEPLQLVKGARPLHLLLSVTGCGQGGYLQQSHPCRSMIAEDFLRSALPQLRVFIFHF